MPVILVVGEALVDLVVDASGALTAALGGAPVEARADSSRYVDVTVLLGASWRPPAEPLHP